MPRAPGAITWLNAGLGAAAVLAWSAGAPPAASPALAGVLVLVVAALVVDWWPLTMEHRGETLHMTLSGIVVVLGVVFVSPLATLVARLVGSAFSLVFRWRMPRQKLVFNLVVQSMEVWIVASVLAVVGVSATTLDPRTWLAVPLALATSDLVSFAAVLLAMRLVAGRLRLDVVGQMAVGVLYSTALSATFAVVGVILLEVDPAAALGLAAIFALLVQTNRARHGLAERYRNLTSLYSFMDAVTSTETPEVVRSLLREGQRVTGAERSTLLLSDGGAGAAFSLEGDAEATVVEGRTDPAAIAALAAAVHDGRLVDAGATRPVPALTGTPGEQAMIVSFGQGSVTGVLVLEGRRGNMPAFDPTDLQLARGLARHAGTTLVTSRLVEQLQDSTKTMQRLALYDRDTGLPNRTGLLRRELDTTGAAVALVEVVDLHTVEGTFGHRSASQVVTALAKRLQDLPDVGITAVARTTENRFAVVLGDAEDPVDTHRRIKLLRRALQAPIRETGVNIEVMVVIGVATAEATSGSMDHMLRAAAGALNHARILPAGDTVWFDPSLDARATARIRLASDLRDAIDGGELGVAYQPKVDLRSGRVVGVEALCRWTTRDGRAVDPTEFIHIAEQTGLIRPLTELVADIAIAQAGRWHRDGLELTLALNMSPDVLQDPATVAHLLRRCEQAGLPPESLTVEITESLMMSDLHRGSGILATLDDAGVRISVDDFGTGYSSLAQLKDLPVDELKIDKSFVMGLESSPADQAITEAIVAMARRLDLDVVAEGVETPAAMALLREAGCDVAQGYLLGRPMSARDVALRAGGTAAGTDRVVPFRRQQPGGA
jgi:predicted signal transduction protein with EAL and GGDEF domain